MFSWIGTTLQKLSWSGVTIGGPATPASVSSSFQFPSRRFLYFPEDFWPIQQVRVFPPTTPTQDTVLLSRQPIQTPQPATQFDIGYLHRRLSVVQGTPPRTGSLTLSFPGQAAQSWSEGLILAKQTIAGTDYLLVGGTCDYSGTYTGTGSLGTTDFRWTISRVSLLDGSPDLTFGTYGSWCIDHGGSDDEMSGIVVDSSNRITMGGTSWDGTFNAFKMVRLLQDGSVDMGFGVFGYQTIFSGENGRYQASQLTLMPNDKVFAFTNRFTGGAHATRISRHLLNGALDTGFGKFNDPLQLGFLEIEPSIQDTEGSDYCGHLLLQSDGKVLVSGRYDVSGTSHYEGFVARVNADGKATDSTFGAQVGTTGVYMKLIDFSLGMGNLNGICFSGTGILASGSAKRDVGEHQAGAIVLLDSSGNLVTSFNGTGVLEAHLGSQNSDYLFQPVVTAGGAFRFFGMSGSGNQDIANTVSATSHALSVGYTSAGVLDTIWNGTGVYEDSTSTLSTFFNVLPLSDGRILASGHTGYPSTSIAQALVRMFQTSGAVDLGFGNLVTPPSPPTAPTVTTGSSSSVTPGGATIAGTVNPNGTTTTYHFEYGLDANYLNKTAETSAGSGSSPIAANATLTGLLPGKAYHWRLVAYNGSIGLGNDATFTTLAGTLILLSDSFTDTNSTPLRDHTGKSEVDFTGSFYLEVSGRCSIQSNKVHFDSDPDHASPNCKMQWQRETGKTDLTVAATFVWNGGNDGNNRPTGVFSRCQPLGEYSTNEDKFIYAGWKRDSSTFVLGYMIGGALTDLDSISFTVTNGVSNRITLTVSSTIAYASITGGSRPLTGDLTPAATLASYTLVGCINHSGLGDTVDDFVIALPLQSLNFNGTTGYVDLGNSALLNPTGAMTLSMWVKLLSAPSGQSWMFGRDDNTAGRSYAFGFGSSKNILLQINGSGILSGNGAIGDVSLNTWHHVGLTGDPTNGWKAYVDGSVIPTGGTASWTAPVSSTAHTCLGRRSYSGFEGYLNAIFHDARIYSTALSGSDMALLASGKDVSGEVGYWPMAEGTGTSIVDLSGNGLNGTLTGGVVWTADAPAIL